VGKLWPSLEGKVWVAAFSLCFPEVFCSPLLQEESEQSSQDWEVKWHSTCLISMRL
jgi:hypothetical protein